MGSFAQCTADEYQLTRQDMDGYAIESLARANDAISSGAFADEIAAGHRQDPQGRRDRRHRRGSPAKADPSKIPELRAAFAKDGTITAATSSSISDGAAARGADARERRQGAGQAAGRADRRASPRTRRSRRTSPPPRSARSARCSTRPAGRPTTSTCGKSTRRSPASRCSRCATSASRTTRSTSTAAPPRSATRSARAGTRIIVTLLNALKQKGLKRGVASLCIGGGEGTALAVELV